MEDSDVDEVVDAEEVAVGDEGVAEEGELRQRTRRFVPCLQDNALLCIYYSAVVDACY